VDREEKKYISLQLTVLLYNTLDVNISTHILDIEIREKLLGQ
jgi:hypothetical protein